jgi:hypothetical protein
MKYMGMKTTQRGDETTQRGNRNKKREGAGDENGDDDEGVFFLFTNLFSISGSFIGPCFYYSP